MHVCVAHVQFIYKSSHGGVNVMDPARPEIQECFTRAGAEMDAWKYVWRVSIRLASLHGEPRLLGWVL